MSFGVPAKHGEAKDLIEADDIGRKAVADFIDSQLVKKNCLSQPHKMLQANKVLRLAVDVKPFGLHLLRKRPEVFMIP